MKNRNYPLYSSNEIATLKELIYFDTPKSDEKTAFMYAKDKNTVSVTYAQFADDMEALGTAFYNMGLRRTHIAVMGENSYEWILTYFSVVNGGSVIVPIDKELSAAETENVLKASDSTVLVYSDTYACVAEELKAKGLEIKYISMKEMPLLIEKGRAADRTEFCEHKINKDDLAAICYTSGTTGVPKGVMLSHYNLATDVVSSTQNVYISGSSMLTLPLHHTFAFSTSVLAMLLYRVTISINSSIRYFKRDLKVFKPQNMFLVPLYVETIYKDIWKTAEKNKKDSILRHMISISSVLRKFGIDIRRFVFKEILDELGGNLDLIVSGGALLDEKYIEFFDNIGVTTLNGYGITECSPVVAVNRNKCYYKNSVGQVLSCCKVKVDEGEILVKGTNVMKGYYKNEDATKAAFKDGWFKTGDIGEYKNGVLYVKGRYKNVIILSNGKNVYPEELEMMLSKIDGIEECMVYEEEGIITAEIYPSDKGKISSVRGRIDELNHELPIYKQIKGVKFREEEFPKTTTKKIKRR